MLVCVELIVLLTMVLSFRVPATSPRRQRPVAGSSAQTAALFWVGMMGLGLVVPFVLYVVGGRLRRGHLVAPVLVLCGGCLLRYLVVNTDDRAEIPGENRYYNRLADPDAEFVDQVDVRR